MRKGGERVVEQRMPEEKRKGNRGALASRPLLTNLTNGSLIALGGATGEEGQPGDGRREVKKG